LLVSNLFCRPKALFTVAWGNAPGPRTSHYIWLKAIFTRGTLSTGEHGLQANHIIFNPFLGRCPRLRQIWLKAKIEVPNFEARLGDILGTIRECGCIHKLDILSVASSA
jgi:hypothetical protein